MRERDRQTERDRDRDRETQTDRQTETQTERQRKTDTETERLSGRFKLNPDCQRKKKLMSTPMTSREHSSKELNCVW